MINIVILLLVKGMKMSKETKKERPEIVTDEHLEYLDWLRDSGQTNMFGAGQYLEMKFDVSKRDAKTILLYWMDSFSERHGE
jgi:hypothetical protein